MYGRSEATTGSGVLVGGGVMGLLGVVLFAAFVGVAVGFARGVVALGGFAGGGVASVTGMG